MSIEVSDALESVWNFIDVEMDALDLQEYVQFLEGLLDEGKSRLVAAREDLYGN
jgi:hypothetical protein